MQYICFAASTHLMKSSTLSLCCVVSFNFITVLKKVMFTCTVHRSGPVSCEFCLYITVMLVYCFHNHVVNGCLDYVHPEPLFELI